MDLVPSVQSRGSALKALIGAWKGELHDVGFAYALSNQPTAYTCVCVNSMPQNDLQSGRDGARIALNRIAISYVLAGPVAPTVPLTTGSRVRVALLWDKQTNGVAPTEAMIQETTVAGNETMAIMPNYNYRDRLTVLYDRLHVLNGLDTPMIATNFSVDLTGKQTTFVAGAGTGVTADVITGGLFWYVKADGNNTTSNALTAALYFHP